MRIDADDNLINKNHFFSLPQRTSLRLHLSTFYRPDERLETFSVNDGGTCFIVFLLCDPHLMEGGQRGQNGSSDPDGVFPLWWCDDLDLHGGRGEGGDLLLHTVGNTSVHGCATGENGVGVKVVTDVNVTLHDRVVCRLVDSARLHANECRLEESFRSPEPFITDGDDLAIREFVGLL